MDRSGGTALTFKDFEKLSAAEAFDMLQNAVSQRDAALSEVSRMESELEETRAARQSDKGNLESQHQAELDALNAELVKLQGFVDACGGTEIGKQLAEQARRDKLMQEKQKALEAVAKIDAELAKPLVTG